MRITDLLDVRSISLNAAPADKSQTLDAAVSLMTRSGKINDEEAYRKQVYAREEESTTGIGEGIAIPHGKCDAVEKPGLVAMVIPGGVDFDSLDGEPVTLLFLIAAPKVSFHRPHVSYSMCPKPSSINAGIVNPNPIAPV